MFNAQIKNKQGEIIRVRSYEPEFRGQIFSLFEEGYPDSFDEYDLDAIQESMANMDEGEGQEECFFAKIGEELIAASFIYKVVGPQDQWEVSYIFTRDNLRGRGIGRILIGVQEEYFKDKIRILFAINPGILPEDVISYPFWKATSYELWGILPGYFRDDLSGIFLVKRNPYYRVGRGIPRNSGWEPEMTDSLTGKRISQERYREILYSLKKVPKEKWGLDLIGRENVLTWNLKNKKEAN